MDGVPSGLAVCGDWGVTGYWVWPSGTSGVPHPGAAMTPPFCDSDLYLLGFTGLIIVVAVAVVVVGVGVGVGRSPALTPGSEGDPESWETWEAGGHLSQQQDHFCALSLGGWVFNPFLSSTQHATLPTPPHPTPRPRHQSPGGPAP